MEISSSLGKYEQLHGNFSENYLTGKKSLKYTSFSFKVL